MAALNREEFGGHQALLVLMGLLALFAGCKNDDAQDTASRRQTATSQATSEVIVPANALASSLDVSRISHLLISLKKANADKGATYTVFGYSGLKTNVCTEDGMLGAIPIGPDIQRHETKIRDGDKGFVLGLFENGRETLAVYVTEVDLASTAAKESNWTELAPVLKDFLDRSGTDCSRLHEALWSQPWETTTGSDCLIGSRQATVGGWLCSAIEMRPSDGGHMRSVAIMRAEVRDWPVPDAPVEYTLFELHPATD